MSLHSSSRRIPRSMLLNRIVARSLAAAFKSAIMRSPPSSSIKKEKVKTSNAVKKQQLQQHQQQQPTTRQNKQNKHTTNDTVAAASEHKLVRDLLLQAANAPTNKCFVQNSLNTGRFDFPGSSNTNELVSKNTPSLLRSHAHLRFIINFATQFVHKLHNYLQKNGQSGGGGRKDNEDEIQVMCVEKNRGGKNSSNSSSSTSAAPFREIFVASNQERVSQADLDRALSGALAGPTATYKISPRATLVQGVVGRHAEQKLIEFFHRKFSSCESKNSVSSVFIVGERLPCATCYLFSHLAKSSSSSSSASSASAPPCGIQMLPSSGHLYIKNVADSGSAVQNLSATRAYEILSGKGHVICQEW